MNLARHLGIFSWAVASRALPLFYGLIFVLIVIPSLNVSELGRYIIIFTTFNYIALLNKSLVLNPMLRFGSDTEQFDLMIRSGFQLSLFLYLACGSIIWTVAPLLAAMLRITTADIRLVIPLMAAFFFRDFGFFVQQILYRTSKIFFIEAVYFIGSVIGMLYLIADKGMLTGREALIVNIIAAGASSLLALVFGFSGARLIGRFDVTALKRIVNYGFYTLPIGLSSSFIYGADTLVLGIIYNPAVVGVYGGAKKVYQVVSAITQAVGILVLPYVSRLSASERKDDIRALFEKVSIYIWLGLAVCALIGCLLAERLYMFLGPDYSASASILMIMLIAAPFEGLFHATGNILYGIGEAKKVALVSTVSLVVLLLLLLPGAYFLGIKGAAGALTVSLLISGVWMFRVSGKYLDSGLKASLTRLMNNIRGFWK